MTTYTQHLDACRALLAGTAVRAKDIEPARLHLAGKAAQLQRLRRWPADARGQVQALRSWALGEVAR